MSGGSKSQLDPIVTYSRENKVVKITWNDEPLCAALEVPARAILRLREFTPSNHTQYADPNRPLAIQATSKTFPTHVQEAPALSPSSPITNIFRVHAAFYSISFIETMRSSRHKCIVSVFAEDGRG